MDKNEINGEPVVHAGVILPGNYSTWDDAIRALGNRSTSYDPNYTFEITGVEGNYKIIRRDKVASRSQFINRK